MDGAGRHGGIEAVRAIGAENGVAHMFRQGKAGAEHITGGQFFPGGGDDGAVGGKGPRAVPPAGENREGFAGQEDIPRQWGAHIAKPKEREAHDFLRGSPGCLREVRQMHMRAAMPVAALRGKAAPPGAHGGAQIVCLICAGPSCTIHASRMSGQRHAGGSSGRGRIWHGPCFFPVYGRAKPLRTEQKLYSGYRGRNPREREMPDFPAQNGTIGGRV